MSRVSRRLFCKRPIDDDDGTHGEGINDIDGNRWIGQRRNHHQQRQQQTNYSAVSCS